jgi:hypothetical protein
MRVRLGFMIGLAVLTGGSAAAREVVPFEAGIAPGTILIRTSERRLYFVRPDGTA